MEYNEALFVLQQQVKETVTYVNELKAELSDTRQCYYEVVEQRNKFAAEVERLKDQIGMLTSDYATKQVLNSYAELSLEDRTKIDNLMKALQECK